MERHRFSDQSGFSLAETIVATGLLAAALVNLAQLFAIAVKTNSSARTGTFASVLAQQKMEQLRGLAWGFDTLGLPLSDTTTDTTVSPETPAGGTGLAPSPAGSLGANMDGYVDYLDVNGNLLGGGTAIRANAMYIRRWSVEPLPTNPNNTVILQVLVTRIRDRGAANEDSVARLPDEARLISVKTRKAT